MTWPNSTDAIFFGNRGPDRHPVPRPAHQHPNSAAHSAILRETATPEPHRHRHHHRRRNRNRHRDGDEMTWCNATDEIFFGNAGLDRDRVTRIVDEALHGADDG